MKDNTQGQKDSGTGYKRGDPKWFERRKSKRTRSHDLICTKRPSHQSNRIPNPKKLFDGWCGGYTSDLLLVEQPTVGGNWGISPFASSSRNGLNLRWQLISRSVMSSCHVVCPTSSLFLFFFFTLLFTRWCRFLLISLFGSLLSFFLVHLRLLRPFGHSAHLPPSLLLAFAGKRMEKRIWSV